MKRTLIYLIIINIVLIGQLVYGKEKISSYSDLIEDCRALIKHEIEQGKYVGVSAALILGDSITWKEGFGYADKDKKIPMTTQTNLSIGSATKPFTALAIMQMQEKGLIDINKPLIDYLPQFSIKTRGIDIKEITLKTIINHSSGIPGDVILNAWSGESKYTDVVKYLKSEYLCYPPNMVHHYSNAGYDLLGHTIFTITGQDYPEFIQKNILEPLKMDQSGFINSKSLQNVSMTYDLDGNYCKLIDGRDLPAGCGFYSNIDDLIKYAKELIAISNGKQGSIIKTETLKKIFNVQNDEVIFDSHKRGLGWYLFLFKNNSNVFAFHEGSTHLSNAAIAIIPEKRMAAILLINTIGGLALWNEVGSKWLKACDIQLIYKRKYVHFNRNDISETYDIPDDSLKKHVGTYAQLRFTVQIKKENEKLVLLRNNEHFLLKPISKEAFVPYKLYDGDSLQILPKQRYYFKDINNYHFLFLEDGDEQYQLGYKVDVKEINDIWKNRIGRYKIYGYQLKGWNKLSEAELYVADNNLLQLKLFYTEGQFVYNILINSDNELIFCGIEGYGGETLRFSKDGQKDIMIYSGLTLNKVN